MSRTSYAMPSCYVSQIYDEKLCDRAKHILHVKPLVYGNCIFDESKSYRVTTSDNENLIGNVNHSGSEKIISHVNLYGSGRTAYHENPIDYETRYECGMG